MDYYAALGVARTSEDVVIRAAYLALMRRYHPDSTSAPDAAQRAREITAAYAVLGDEAKRRQYDQGWDPQQSIEVLPARGKQLPVGPLSFGITILCVGAVIMAIWTRQPGPQGPLATAPPLSAAQPAVSVEASPRTAAESACASKTASNSVRRELLRQAADIRGTEPQAFRDFSRKLIIRTIQMPAVNPPSSGSVTCSVAITIELAEDVSLSRGKRTLAGNGEYIIDVSSGGAGALVEFIPDPRLIIDLASLEVAASPRAPPVPEEQTASSAAFEPRFVGALPPQAPRAVDIYQSKKGVDAAPALARSRVKPVVPVKSARSQCGGQEDWAVLVCMDANLAALDEQLSVFERQSAAHADFDKRVRLERSRAEFERDRVRCRTEACVRRSLVGRTTKIAEIMRSAPSFEAD